MFSIKKWLVIGTCIFCGGISLSKNNCSAHEVSFYFGDNGYEIGIDRNIYMDDYSLMSNDTYAQIEPLIEMDKTVEITSEQFSEFKKLFSSLSKHRRYLSMHSDYNSYDYIPFTSEVKDSLNEKYINLFRFIKKQIL